MIPQRAHNFGTYFVTGETWGRRPLFRSERIAELFIVTLFHYRSDSKYLLHEFVLMPDHFHLILTPNEIALERAMQLVKGGFSYRVKKELESNLEIWQRGFTDHRIRDAEDYVLHCEYVRQNPVKAKLAAKAEDYPQGSASGKFELDPIPQRLKPFSIAAQRHG